MHKRIQLALSRATESHFQRGLVWYEEAHTEVRRIAANTGQPVETVAAVVATLSPGVNWERNLFEAESLITGADISYTTYSSQVAKARRILSERLGIDACTGCKVRSFAANLMLNPDHVTIDRHMLTALQYEKYLTPKRYAGIAKAFLQVAKTTPYHAYQLQAVIWLVERESKKLKGLSA